MFGVFRIFIMFSVLGCAGSKKPASVQTKTVPALMMVEWTGEKSPRWAEVETLESEQKYEAAAAVVEEILATSRENKQSEDFVRAVIRTVQLRTALHGYETAVRFLADETWPDDLLAKTTLHLYFAQTLTHYSSAYGWEIRQRERVVSSDEIDLKKWTWAQIHKAANAQYAAAWEQREALGNQQLTVLKDYLRANDYPHNIRSTLRDALTYLWVEALADTGRWRPEEQNKIHTLALDEMLADHSNDLGVETPETHPLRRLSARLADLENWHRVKNRPIAAFEARRRRIERLHQAITNPQDRKTLLADLETQAEKVKDHPWWAMGQATRAELTRQAPDEDALIRAHAIASAGRNAYPQSVGGERCQHIVESLEQPQFNLDGMMVDGVNHRSVGVMHKNLSTLYFRAWRYDLLDHVARQKDYNLMPNRRDIEPLIDTKAHVAEWTVTLPKTEDFKQHRTWVVPPMAERGAYIIAASPDAAFNRNASPLQVTLVTLSDLLLTSRSGTKVIDGRVFEANSGDPATDAEVFLYQMDWQRGHKLKQRKKVNSSGAFSFRGTVSKQHFIVAKRGVDVILEHDALAFGRDYKQQTQRSAFVYTDRSVYRPQQTLQWQIVAWKGRAKEAKFNVDPKASVTVFLKDGNQQVVAEKKVMTNAFGSAAGSFLIPAGRALGQWSVDTSIGTRGGDVRVEEYKRPTFEAELLAPDGEQRLNRPATLVGSAEYYFGLPVTAGAVSWRVHRTANYPRWWSWYFGSRHQQGAEVVATGEAKLSDEGTFKIEFVPSADERLATGMGRAVTYRYEVSADVTDEGGETRSASRAIQLGFVAVKAQVALPHGFLSAGEDAEVSITRTNLNGQGNAGAGRWAWFALKAPDRIPTPSEVAVPKDHVAYATEGDQQRPRWQSNYSPAMALSMLADGQELAGGRLAHAENGKATLTLEKPKAGAYRLRYFTTDAFGADYETEQIVVVGGGLSPIPVAIDLRLQDSMVNVGGVAKVLVHGGFAQQKLYLQRWRDGTKVSEKLHTVGKDSALIEIPVGEKDRGGFSLTLTFVRNHEFVRLQKNVSVPWDNKELAVSFSTFRDKLRPGQKETWTVRVQGPKATTSAAEVLAYMYDKSLDVFAPHHTPTPRGLYPYFGDISWVRSTVRPAHRIWVQAGQFEGISNYPHLSEDGLNFLSGYGIGGVGRGRGGGGRMMRKSSPRSMPESEMMAPMASNADGSQAFGALAKNKSKEMSKDTAARDETGPADDLPTMEVRSNFSETAFFKPQLKLGPDGTVDIEFEVPDSVTAWNVWVHAIGKDLSSGSVKKEVNTVKELMVRPYLPRFLRENDEAKIEVVVNNATEAALSGHVDFDIVDPVSEKSVLADFGLKKSDVENLRFNAKGMGSDRLSFVVKAPVRVGLVAFSVTAHTKNFSDGELRPIPLLPGRVHLAQSRFTTLKDNETKVLQFDDLAENKDETLINEQLVATLDGQLFYGVLSSLPYLVNYPYECTEQTLNRFVSTGILSSLYGDYPAVAKMAKKLSQRDTALESWDDNDPNRKLALEETPWVQQAQGGVATDFDTVLDPRVAKATREAAISKLKKSQTSLGGFPWWSGGRPSPYMTLYVLHGLSKASEFGVEVPKGVTQKAWNYLRQHYIDEAMREAIAKDCCWEFITTINYVLSNFPGESYGGNVFDPSLRKKMLDFSFMHWKRHSPMLKGYLALTLKRAERLKDAQLVWESVLDSAKEKEDQGTFWAPEDRSWLWYNDTIESHAFALRTTMELMPDWEKTDGLVLWLFLNKKLNHWESTRATSEVIYSLAHYLKDTGRLGLREETQISIGERTKTFVFEPDEFTGKKNQIVVAGPDIVAADATVTISKKTKGFQMASATWHFSTEKMPAAAHGDFLGVTRHYFKRTKSGSEVLLEPLKEGAKVSVGDEIEVQLSLSSKHALEYVHLRDPRAAGFEPMSLRSEHKWDLGISWFEEVRDSATNFFFEWLPHGEYTFKYRLRASTAGTFKVGPAMVQPMYAPEFVAYSSGDVLGIQ